jgi:DNA-binding MarR family transcriptional regulator
MQKRIFIATPAEAPDELTRLARAFDHLHGIVDSFVFQRMAYALQGGEFSFSQLHALYCLYRFGPQTIAELAKGGALSQTTASRMVERLVQNGLAERKEVATDRRQKRVELTEAGIERLQDLQSFTVKMYSDLLRQQPEDVLHRLATVLAEMDPGLPIHPLQRDQPSLPAEAEVVPTKRARKALIRS